MEELKSVKTQCAMHLPHKYACRLMLGQVLLLLLLTCQCSTEYSTSENNIMT